MTPDQQIRMARERAVKAERERVLDALVSWLSEEDLEIVEIKDLLEFIETIRNETK